jgi:hypothetical protein
VCSVLRRVTGVDLLADLSTFFHALGGVIDGFTERAAAVKALLNDPGTTFLIVTSPQREPVDEAIFFHGKLREARMPFGGLIVNRVTPSTQDDDVDVAALTAQLSGPLEPALAGTVARTYAETQVLAHRDLHSIARLEAELGVNDPILVPQIDGDVHDIAGLLGVYRHLFGVAADAGTLTGRPSVRPVRARSAPVIDGRLDDAVWRDAARITDFVQRQPLDGAAATEATDVAWSF